MDNRRTCLRVGVAAIGCALALRLLSAGSVYPDIGREAVSAMLFLSTGRMVRLTQPQPPQQEAPATEPVMQTQPLQQQELPALFTQQDGTLVQIHNTSGYAVDTAALLEHPLQWDLTQDGPTVLILHTHGSEGYQESENYRTLDENYNVVSIGQHLAQRLETGGIGVVHDKTLHDQPSYNGSYTDAREAIEQYLARYPTIRMVLDIHRDAAVDSAGQQIGYTVDTEDGAAAKLMLVMGTDAGGFAHAAWQENLALAVKLHAALEKNCAGICRPMQLRTSRFNQDLCPGALLVEVGAAGNTRQQALLAAEVLAEGILCLAHGA